mmetsp:Transcript_13920/g.25767  ORF Transcript_13920/g.25767 Transcript_13920/m.25767 type:complete len:156 (+) Transcript_13920:153-620(+)
MSSRLAEEHLEQVKLRFAKALEKSQKKDGKSKLHMRNREAVEALQEEAWMKKSQAVKIGRTKRNKKKMEDLRDECEAEIREERLSKFETDNADILQGKEKDLTLLNARIVSKKMKDSSGGRKVKSVLANILESSNKEHKLRDRKRRKRTLKQLVL